MAVYHPLPAIHRAHPLAGLFQRLGKKASSSCLAARFPVKGTFGDPGVPLLLGSGLLSLVIYGDNGSSAVTPWWLSRGILYLFHLFWLVLFFWQEIQAPASLPPALHLRQHLPKQQSPLGSACLQVMHLCRLKHCSKPMSFGCSVLAAALVLLSARGKQKSRCWL